MTHRVSLLRVAAHSASPARRGRPRRRTPACSTTTKRAAPCSICAAKPTTWRASCPPPAYDPRSIRPSRPAEPAGRDAARERGPDEPADDARAAAEGVPGSRHAAQEVRAAAGDDRWCRRHRAAGETDALSAAQQQFRNGNFKAAAASFRAFIAKYPQSLPADRAVLVRQCAIRAARLPRFDCNVARNRQQVPSTSARSRRPGGNRHEPARTRPEGGREDVRAGRVAVRRVERSADRAGQARDDQKLSRRVVDSLATRRYNLCSLGRCPSC